MVDRLSGEANSQSSQLDEERNSKKNSEFEVNVGLFSSSETR